MITEQESLGEQPIINVILIIFLIGIHQLFFIVGEDTIATLLLGKPMKLIKNYEIRILMLFQTHMKSL